MIYIYIYIYIYITADKESKELSAYLEWIVYCIVKADQNI